MDNRAVIERIMKNLAFEVEAVPNNKAAHADGRTYSSKTDPLNVKIKVRKKEINGPISEPEIVLRKVCLVNSTETIMSFDMFMDMESEKKIVRKPRKRLFNKLKPGVSDDDDQPYTSDIVNSPDEPGGSSASKSDGILRQPLNLAKNSYETFFTTAQRKNRTFMGQKCKPGGCLDPPFGEDKYSYIPTVQESSTHASKKIEEHRQVDTKDNTKLDVKNIDKNKRKDLPLKIKSDDNKVKETSSILNLYKVESPRDSIITYPPEDINQVHKTRADTKSSDDKKSSDAKIFISSSIEKARQSINETSFFSPVKGVKKDPSYVQQEPLKRHSFNPKSIKKPFPISDSLNSVPLEQSNTGPPNIDIEPKVFDKQQLQSEPDSKDIEKIDVKPFIVPIQVDEEVTPMDGQINSLINSKMESLVEEDSKGKSPILTNYESAENIDKIESPIVVIKKHSIQSKNSRKYSNDNKNPESYQLLLKPTQSPQKVYETVHNKDYDNPKEIKPLFVKEKKDSNRILSDQNQQKDLIEESKPDVEKILSDKTEYLVTETSNDSCDIISIDDQKSISDVSVENVIQNKNKFREPSKESINDNDYFDHKTRLTEVLTEEPSEENESLNIHTKDDQSDKKSNIENQILNTQDQNLIENAKKLDPSDRKPDLVNRLLDSLKQSLDVNSKAVDPSEPKPNLENKGPITSEQSLDVNTHQNQKIIANPNSQKQCLDVNTKIPDPSEPKLNLKDKDLNSHEQSLDTNIKVLEPSELTFNLKDKDPNSHEQSLDTNIKVLEPSEPTFNLKGKDPNSHEQSLDTNNEVLEPSEPTIKLKNKGPNSYEQSSDINIEVLDPSKPTFNLKNKDPNSHEESSDVNTEVLDTSEPKPNLEDKDPIYHGQSLIINSKLSDQSETQLNLNNNLLNIKHQYFDVNTKDTNSYIYDLEKNIFGEPESELNQPSIQTGSIIKQHDKVKVIEDKQTSETELLYDNQSMQIVFTNKLPNEKIITQKDHINDYIPNHNMEIIEHGSFDEGKVSHKIKKESISPDNCTQKSILSESNKNKINEPKEKFLPDINPTIDPKTVVLNLGFHRYLNNKNERVIETVDGNNVNRYPKDSLSVIKSEIQLFANQKYHKLNVPIDSTFHLAIKINQNYKRDDVVPAKTRIKPVPEFPELAKPSTIAGGKMNCEQRICYEKILQNTLTDIYEQKLIPLRKVLRDLKSDIDKLVGQQTIVKKKVHGLEKIKPPRLNVSSKKCGPCKQ